MAYGDADDVAAHVEDQRGDEGVGRTDGEDPVHHVPAEHAVGAHLDAARLADDDAVEVGLDAAGQALERSVALALELSDDHVVLGSFEEGRQVLRYVLQVVVHGDHEVAAGLAEAAEGCALLPDVAHELDAAHGWVLLRQLLDGRPRTAVGRGVVDEDQLVAILGPLAEHRVDALRQPAEALDGVVDGHHDGEGRHGCGAYRRARQRPRWAVAGRSRG